MKKATFDKRIHMTPLELAVRWATTPRTLEDWRTDGKGPKYLKLEPHKGGKVVYRRRDISAYEKKVEQKPRGKSAGR
jgi:hypothetical protein